jgi:hypothetical protein
VEKSEIFYTSLGKRPEKGRIQNTEDRRQNGENQVIRLSVSWDQALRKSGCFRCWILDAGFSIFDSF